MQNLNIGIQLYSVREQIAALGLDAVLEGLMLAGCNTVELAGFYNLTPCEIKSKLDQYNLRPVSAHIELEAIENSIAYIDKLGISQVYIPWYSTEELLSDTGYKKFIKDINSVKRLLDERGICFGYHNHSDEFAGGCDILRRITDDIDAFFIELDIFWAKAAGADPCRIIESYGNKIKALHIKDMDNRASLDNPLEYPNAVIGYGKCNASAAFDAARSLGVDTFIIEVEGFPCDYREYVEKSIESINRFLHREGK